MLSTKTIFSQIRHAKNTDPNFKSSIYRVDPKSVPLEQKTKKLVNIYLVSIDQTLQSIDEAKNTTMSRFYLVICINSIDRIAKSVDRFETI